MSSCTQRCPGGAAPHRVHPRGRPRLRRRGLEQPEDGGRNAEAGPRGAARRHAGAVLRAAGDACWQTRVTRVPCAGVLAQQVRAPHRHVPLPHRQTEGRAYFVFSYSEAVLLFKEHTLVPEKSVQYVAQFLASADLNCACARFCYSVSPWVTFQKF